MTQTQIEPDHESKRTAISLVEDEKQPRQEPEPPKPKRRIPKPVLILGAIALLYGVGYGVGIELTIKNNQGLAKPGMPADGRILLPEQL